MFSIPPMPSWDGLHPIIVHFPIGLLLTVPILIVLGLLWRKHRFGFNAAALAMMVMGTIAAFVATATGDAAGELAERTAGVQAVLEHHEELGETTRNIFAALTAVFAVMLGVGYYLRAKLNAAVAAGAILVFLAAYAAGSLVLMNTGHEGGRLVHEFGVRAVMGPPTAAALPSPGAAAPQTPARKTTEKDDD
jgi:uncharacterized membrane protein